MRRAIIDIGTNTVKLLVADVGANVVPVFQDAITTRLGAGVNATRRLDAQAMQRTLEAVAAFSQRARELGAAQLQTFATSAARDAENGRAFLEAAQKKAGVAVRVLSGDEEAQYVFAGVTSDAAFAGKTLRTIDIGGGSTEICLGDANGLRARRSLDIGAVRLTEMFCKADPMTARELASLREHVEGALGKLPESLKRGAPMSDAAKSGAVDGEEDAPPLFVATGGTATTLAAICLKRNEGKERLSDVSLQSASEEAKTYGGVDHYELSSLPELLEGLREMPLAQRQQIPGLPRARADIIVAGAAILAEAMRFFGARTVTVSVRGLRYGALILGARDDT